MKKRYEKIVSRTSMVRISSAFNLSVLSGSGIKLVLDGDINSNECIQEIYTIEKIILAVSSTHCILTWNMTMNRMQTWRYLDWIITAPLLLRSFHLLAVEKGYTGSFRKAMSWNILLVWCVYQAEYTSAESMNERKYGKQQYTKDNMIKATTFTKRTLGLLAGVALIQIFSEVKKWNNHLIENKINTGRLPYYFYAGWSAYGINFFNPSPEMRQICYNALDIIMKGAFITELNHVIGSQFSE
jgi:hypothetical protein